MSSGLLRFGTSISLFNMCQEKERRGTQLVSLSPRITEFPSASLRALPANRDALAPDDADPALVGEDSREILKDRRYRLIDLVMGQLSAAEDGQLIVDQARRDKYALKSRLFADVADAG